MNETSVMVYRDGNKLVEIKEGDKIFLTCLALNCPPHKRQDILKYPRAEVIETTFHGACRLGDETRFKVMARTGAGIYPTPGPIFLNRKEAVQYLRQRIQNKITSLQLLKKKIK